MTISPPLSVTQSTAPARSATKSAQEQNWHAALETATAAPVSTDPQAQPPQTDTTTQAEDPQPNQPRNTTLQAVSKRLGEADQPLSVQTDVTTVTSGVHGPSSAPKTTGKDKKEDAKTPLQGNITALPVGLTVASAVTSPAPDVTTTPDSDGKSAGAVDSAPQVGTNVAQTSDSLPPGVHSAPDSAPHTKAPTPEPQAQKSPLVQTASSPSVQVVASPPTQTGGAAPSPSAPSITTNTIADKHPVAGKHPALTDKPVISASAITSGMQTTSNATAAHSLDEAALDQSFMTQQKVDLKKTTNPLQPLQAVGTNGVSSAVGEIGPVDKAAQTSFAANPGIVNLAPAALSATITALHQSNQSSVMLRLDPPDLGHLSVQIKMDAHGSINVLFVPTTADAAQTLQASLHQLGGIMAQSGLTLSQAEVGGQFSQSGGQNGQQSGYTPPRQTSVTATTASTMLPAAQAAGLSAYA